MVSIFSSLLQIYFLLFYFQEHSHSHPLVLFYTFCFRSSTLVPLIFYFFFAVVAIYRFREFFLFFLLVLITAYFLLGSLGRVVFYSLGKFGGFMVRMVRNGMGWWVYGDTCEIDTHRDFGQGSIGGFLLFSFFFLILGLRVRANVKG
ncbi:hypothetical protein QBC43DRAFT_310922 [Cladorrhinum sp. PSN259]|nr:hypothetical protein QBC43DRAFT_310922 [Cladorrhinum sp. PSN259]